MQEEKKMKSLWVDLAGVDEAPGPCCMSFGFDLNPLKRSIAAVGLINKPFVAKDGDDVEVVAGYRRFMALKSLGWNKVRCWDLSDLAPRDRVLMNFYDNYTTRRFNDVEISMVLRRMVPHVPEHVLLSEYMPLLGLPSHKPTLDLYLFLETLEPPIKAALAEKALSLRALKPLLDMDGDVRQTVFQWISNFKLNFNQQLQLINYILDLSEIENKTVHALLEEKGFATLGQAERMNTPQKAKQVLERLRARCYPSLTGAEHIFRKRVANLRLPEGVVIKHPPFFEDPWYHLEIAFRNGTTLVEKLKVLLGLEDLQEIRDPWSEGS